MLVPEKVLTALIAKRKRFTTSKRSQEEALTAMEHALSDFDGLSLEECEAKLKEIPRPGAHPSSEKESHQGVVVPFSERWSNHAQARAWAMEILKGKPTFAADGSQIVPSSELSIPVGVVQVGWFENPHQAQGDYVKDVAVEILTPEELGDEPKETDGFPGWTINFRRFRREIEVIVEYMERKAGTKPAPLCFFDGSLIISFAGLMAPERQRQYAEAVTQLIDTSAKTKVPLVGYVDTSAARDLVDMLAHLSDATVADRISDATLLRTGMSWGDRSQIFICARNDNMQFNEYYEQVCFSYLKTTRRHPPARVEFPRWIVMAGEHERLFDLVRSECIVGTGYPYALETADALAVLGAQDRERFYRLFQKFSESEGLALHYGRKAISKRGRRR
ncbi:MAG: DNA double-strand break repair nuclease NurA [Anaerolineales bacterium]|nr:DNA double-strand break repair nuclease NurA [Anaerolineales bacterium]